MTTPIKRNVRLKEFGINVNRELEPVEAYLRQTNGSISAGPFRLRTDDNGYITSPQAEMAAGREVFVLGDSFVESSYVQEGERFCDLLCDLDRDGAGRAFRNAGYSGATSLNLLDVLINKICANRNASLVYVLPSNDILSLENKDGFWNAQDKRYSPIQPVRPGGGQKGEFTESAHQLFCVLRSIAGVARAFNLPLFLATCPFVRTAYKDLPWHRIRHGESGRYEQLIDLRSRANQILRDVAFAARVPVIDLEAILDDPALFYDDVHLNAEGSKAAAAAIHGRL
ncbi:MAG: SGNH/GDSL hydrolase family protein [Donghicola eburneus]|nr:SGNH/GDSL hydrolase family protein [Donghicola eburneus]MCI5040353.1 SGNH/GDSL hydrolase family protein [Donghicola eburneus]